MSEVKKGYTGSSSSGNCVLDDTIMTSRRPLLAFILRHSKGPTGSGMRNWALYIENLRSFIVGEIRKTEFDHFVLSELGCTDKNEQLVPLHNAYIMSILVSSFHYRHCRCTTHTRLSNVSNFDSIFHHSTIVSMFIGSDSHG